MMISNHLTLDLISLFGLRATQSFWRPFNDNMEPKYTQYHCN